ncbi:MAG: hypothetical protein GX554_04615 [Elusimicrobia bacterium]|nr:hypothetical protein [Elusimicrobiota bacterium]
MKKLITGLIILLFCSTILCAPNIEITEGLKTGTFQKKIELITKIETSKAKEFLPELGNIITSEENEEIRSKAVLALLNIGDSTCVPYFRDALDDTYWQVRLYGVKGLVRHGLGEDIIPDLKLAMKDSYWQVRYYAATGLSKYGDEKNLPFLLEYLNDSNDTVKAEILWAMLALMGRDEARALFKNLQEDEIRPVFNTLDSSNPELKVRALWLLEATKDKRAIPYFIDMLSDKNDEIKIRALWAIEQFKSEDGGTEIEGLLVDESTKIKIEAIKTLVNLSMKEGTSGLITGLSDKDESVRIYSLWALEKFREPVSYPYIAECLADNSQKVREYTFRLIEQMKDPLFCPILESFFEDTNNPFDSRINALALLGKIGNETEKDFILKQIQSSDSNIRYAAIKAFYNIDKFDTQYLKTLAYLEKYDSSLRVRNEASALAGNIVRQLQEKIIGSDYNELKFALERVDSLVGSKSLQKLLLTMSSSKYPEAREKMLLTVRDVPEKILGSSARKMMQDMDPSMRKLAAIAVGEIKDRESIPLLRTGLKHSDPEFQIICARSLAKMGISDGFSLAIRYMDSKDPYYQRISAETLALLKDKRASSTLLKHLAVSELDVKVVTAWALARLGEEKGLNVLVRLSEESIEPIRTEANKYLFDSVIPYSMRSKIPLMREKMYVEKLGIREVSLKRLNTTMISSPVEIDGFDKEPFWEEMEKAELFIEAEGEDKIKTSLPTTVSVAYDKNNLYLLFVCNDPDTSIIDFNSRDILTVSINPLNSAREWYQFVFHPLEHIKYSYEWKLYTNDTPEPMWTSGWTVKSNIEDKRWLVEMSIPLKDLKVDKISSGDVWSINFQRESQYLPYTSWSGRIDNPAQFGILYFKEQKEW